MPKKQHSKQFKLDAINYRKEHPDLTQFQCAKTWASLLAPLPNGNLNTVTMMVTFP